MKRTNETVLIPVDFLGTDIRTLADGCKTTNHYECRECQGRCKQTDNYCGNCGRKITTLHKRS